MTTWRRGRQLVTARLAESDRPLAEVMEEVEATHLPRVPGTAIYLFRDHGNVPPALAANVRHHHVLHEDVMLVSVEIADVPRVGVRKRARYTNLEGGLIHVRITFGFLDEPDVPAVLRGIDFANDRFDMDHATYFLGRESVSATDRPGMHPVREELFVLLHRGAASAARFFNLPADRVVEVGAQIEL